MNQKNRNKTDEKKKPSVPSTGEGADSAMEALRKKRLPAPSEAPAEPPRSPKK